MKIKNSKLVRYVKESYDELMHKVSWPTWVELQSSAIVVSIASLVIALVIFFMDASFGIQHMKFGSFVWRGLLGFLYGTAN
jgi:preprotein translocase subunit SecE